MVIIDNKYIMKWCIWTNILFYKENKEGDLKVLLKLPVTLDSYVISVGIIPNPCSA